MGSNPSHFSSCGDACPVENVSWDDVQQYIKKLNVKSAHKYRLPSEAEWEYACRAGADQTYCGSNDADSVTVYRQNSGLKTQRVGSKQANAWNLYDMSGNVYEWTQDCDNDYNSYSGAPTNGNAWVAGDCGHRVLRGGSWNADPFYSRAADRSRDGRTSRYSTNGFRLARIAP
jgi:formylglycine-generating enzyme required for sulfatase activity